MNTSSPTQIIDCIRGGQTLPSNESPIGLLWKNDWNNFAPRVGFAYDLSGDGKTSLRGGYGMAYERNFGNVTYNVLFNPPQYLVASIDAPTDTPVLPVYVDNQGPFGGVAGVTKTIPAGSLRHVDQNIVTAYNHFYSLSIQHEVVANTVVSIEYTGSTGRNLYDLADPNKRGAALVYEGTGTASQRPITQYAAFNTRGNRGQSQYHGVTFGIDSRRVGNTGLQFSAKYTLSQAKDNLSSTFSDSSAPTSTSATSTRSTRCWTTATPSTTSATARSSLSSGSCRSSATPRARSRRSWAAGSSPASSRPAPAVRSRCGTARTGSTLLHARRGPGRDQQERHERVRRRPTRTSSRCSTSRRSPAPRAAT